MASIRVPRRGIPALLLLTLGATFALGQPAPAQTGPGQAPDPAAVVATVGGQPITEADIGYAAEDLGQDLQNIPPEQQKAFLLRVLIDMKVMAAAARQANMQESEEFKRRIGYLEDRALRRAYFSDKIAAAVTDEAVKAAYDQYVAGFQPQEEVRARHILVATEADAQQIKQELEAGASFEELARTKSMDPSGSQNGGDLGYFSRGMMVPQFEEAAFALAVGETSAPVQSQFGWHIIRVEDKRQSSPPALADLAPQLQQDLVFKTYDETIKALEAETSVEISDPVLAAQVRQQSEPAAAPAAPEEPATTE